MEREILRFWEENRIFSKLRAQTANGPRWSFLDGPITANNPMGVHHAWGRSLKDMYQRYHAMNGYALRYQNGFDCQGLWVEVEVEKSLGLKTKREIRDYGIENFVRACKERVLTFAARQTEQSVRLGYWCDWDDPRVLLALRDALADGDRVMTAKLPERSHGNGPSQRDHSKAWFRPVRRQLLYVLRREQLHHLGLPEEVPRGRVHLPRARRDAMVRALRDRAIADGSGRRPPHHDTHVSLCALPR